MANRAKIGELFDTKLSQFIGLPANVQWENTTIKPGDSELYLESFFIPGPKNYTTLFVGSNPEESGIYQINVCIQPDVGAGDAWSFANLLENHFQRGLKLEKDGGSIRIVKSVSGPAFYGQKDGKYKVPVSIYYKTII